MDRYYRNYMDYTLVRVDLCIYYGELSSWNMVYGSYDRKSWLELLLLGIFLHWIYGLPLPSKFNLVLNNGGFLLIFWLIFVWIHYFVWQPDDTNDVRMIQRTLVCQNVTC